LVLLAGDEMERLAFLGLEYEDFQHPLDKKALDMVKKLKGLDYLTKKIMELGLEKILKLQFTADCLKLSKNQCGDLYKIYMDACKILDIQNPPELYIMNNPYPNAFTTGFTHPFVVLTHGLIDSFETDELMFVIGHELGHYKCGHVYYHNILRYLDQILQYIGQATLGIGKLIGTGMMYTLFAWSRQSELSADRAGFLVVQDQEIAIRAMIKLMAPTPKIYKSVDIEEILKQAEEFEETSEDKLSKLYKIYYGVHRTHPWTVLRIKHILEWAESDEIQEIFSLGVPLSKVDKVKKRSKRGRKTTLFCPSCRYELKREFLFCPACGYKVQ